MPRLILRPLKIRDVDYVMTWVNDPEVVKNLQHFNKRFTRRDELRFIKKLIKSKNDYAFSIFRKEDNEYIGQGAINQISWENKLGRLSLIIRRAHWNKGYAQEAIPLLLKFAFNKLRLHKVWLMAYATNKKANHLYAKLGFRKDGLLRQEYFWRGRYHDIVRMGMLAKDFRSRS